MLDPNNRRENNHNLKSVGHTFDGSDLELIKDLNDKFGCTQHVKTPQRTYTGDKNVVLDSKITKEILNAIFSDRITANREKTA